MKGGRKAVQTMSAKYFLQKEAPRETALTKLFFAVACFVVERLRNKTFLIDYTLFAQQHLSH